MAILHRSKQATAKINLAWAPCQKNAELIAADPLRLSKEPTLFRSSDRPALPKGPFLADREFQLAP
jgi:hypothetical protein